MMRMKNKQSIVKMKSHYLIEKNLLNTLLIDEFILIQELLFIVRHRHIRHLAGVNLTERPFRQHGDTQKTPTKLDNKENFNPRYPEIHSSDTVRKQCTTFPFTFFHLTIEDYITNLFFNQKITQVLSFFNNIEIFPCYRPFTPQLLNPLCLPSLRPKSVSICKHSPNHFLSADLLISQSTI